MSNIFINFVTGSYADLTAMPPDRAKIIGLSRHRLSTDGDGVTTLVAFHGCLHRYLYGLNSQSKSWKGGKP